MPTLLIANRGEIALRIIHTARLEGYRTVAVFSDADRHALHVTAADTAIAIGGNTPQESYLDIDKLIQAAHAGGADCIHPGYGFVSENAAFARACAEGGLTLIGPSADVIELMGNKRRAKAFAHAAGIPCIPGYQGSQELSELRHHARALGYPIMLKAAAGGGGRGMRIISDDREFEAHYASARAEAQSAFGSDELILEKAIADSRHIEIQVFADQHGNCIHLGERDCSIQRRHQKIIEEAPSPAVSAALRANLGQAATKLARACHYVGAGTVEFLLDAEGNFYFLEMNTRLQVEHGITEMISGTDLVAWQLAVARGEPLPIAQDDVRLRGHAIEVRLYAEDPARDFLPQSGTIFHWQPSGAMGPTNGRSPHSQVNTPIRLDHALASGLEISPFYDPMLGKLMAWGKNREQARRRLCQALENLQLAGPRNNQFFLREILQDATFTAGNAHTGFLARQFSPPPRNPDTTLRARALGCALLHHVSVARSLSLRDQQTARVNWHSGVTTTGRHYRFRDGDAEFSVMLHASTPRHYSAHPLSAAAVSIEFPENPSGQACLQHMDVTVDGVRQRILWHLQQNRLLLVFDRDQWVFEDVTYAPAARHQASGNGRIEAPMDGCITGIFIKHGNSVARGDALITMEAMKMEHTIKADCAGLVTAIGIATGDQVRNGQLLIQIEPNEVEYDTREVEASRATP
ncbi:biotin carboxylase N-terminal domain-containing protein [Microbulbifer sp. SA54]|uniref:ATP-binding protein n=1 Tax=Microbulbifer sp. SA54 TaxID=3401577 RepID=UPI003AAB10D8